MSSLKKVVFAGLMVAMLIVLERLISIQLPIIRIGFAFIPIIVSAIFLGPAWSTAIAVTADIIGASLLPMGPFFPGFTLSAALRGTIYGLFLYKKPSLIRLVISSIIVALFVEIGLTTLWVSMLYGKAYIPLLPARALKETIMFPIQISTIYFLNKVLKSRLEEFLEDVRS